MPFAQECSSMLAPDPLPAPGWTLDQRALESLLRALHPDREQASYAYEGLRERLIQFFVWNGVETPEDLADRALDRLARRISESDEEILDAVGYSVGIARLLLKEFFREKTREKESLAALPDHLNDIAYRNYASVEEEERAAVLNDCLDALTAANRSLIERYFSTEGRTHIQARQRLAEEQGISINTLRNRVMRIRADLERCFTALYARIRVRGNVMFSQKLSPDREEQ
jgi:RNA polymerase sigma factor (sigma-70 family)